MRQARDRAEELRCRLARAPTRLRRLGDEIRGLECQARGRKRNAALRELRLEVKYAKHALAESRALQRQSIEEPHDWSPLLTHDVCAPEANTDYEQTLQVEFDRAHHWRDGTRDLQRASLHALCRKHDLAKLRVPFSELGRGPVPEHPAGHGRALIDTFLKKRAES